MPEPDTRSPVRHGFDRLLGYVDADLLNVDLQPATPLMTTTVDDHGHATGVETTNLGQPGPWWCVDFADGQRYAIWKLTGTVYRVGEHGDVIDEPVF